MGRLRTGKRRRKGKGKRNNNLRILSPLAFPSFRLLAVAVCRMPPGLTRREFLEHIGQCCCLSSVLPVFSTAQSEVAVTSPSQGFRIIDLYVHVWKSDPKYPWAKETTDPPKQDVLPETLA